MVANGRVRCTPRATRVPNRTAQRLRSPPERVGAGPPGVSRGAVRGIERAAGRVQAVITEHGIVAARAVVCAGGAWSRLFCGSPGGAVAPPPGAGAGGGGGAAGGG